MRQHNRDRVRRLKAAQLEIAMQGAAIIARNAPKAFHELERSVSAEPTATGARIRIDAPYTQFVEAGTRPHWPPLAPLIRWAQLKGAAQPIALARAIQKKIAEHGSEPTHFIRNSLPVIFAMADRIYSAALRDR